MTGVRKLRSILAIAAVLGFNLLMVVLAASRGPIETPFLVVWLVGDFVLSLAAIAVTDLFELDFYAPRIALVARNPRGTARAGTIQEIGGGKTRMSIENEFPTVEAMEQLLKEEGLTKAVGQIDAILAGDGV
jgi:hypothetical protein